MHANAMPPSRCVINGLANTAEDAIAHGFDAVEMQGANE